MPLISKLIVSLLLFAGMLSQTRLLAQQRPSQSDPVEHADRPEKNAATDGDRSHAPRPASDWRSWGSDHVGQPLPEYVTGDECLFCHRKIGTTWGDNPHQLTVRPADPEDPAMIHLRRRANEEVVGNVRYLLGRRVAVRYLRRGAGYGTLDVFSEIFRPQSANAIADGHEPDADNTSVVDGNTSDSHWHSTLFGDRCAGCHATAVDRRSRTFSALSIDCFSCHGIVDLKHSTDPSVVLLSKQNRPPRQVVAICGQCHLRGGRSQSTGLPYPNQFVAGDNLFRDYRIDFDVFLASDLHPLDRHIYLNVQQVVNGSDSSITCLDCHDVHGHQSDKHTHLESTPICAQCHQMNGGDMSLHRLLRGPARLQRSSETCDY